MEEPKDKSEKIFVNILKAHSKKQMPEYKPSEVESVVEHFISTVISFYYFNFHSKKLNPAYTPRVVVALHSKKMESAHTRDSVADVWDIYNYVYFYNEYLVNLSEIYSFFYKKKDKFVLSLLNLSEDKRLILRNFRHSKIHIGNEDERLKIQFKFAGEDQVNRILDLWTLEVVVFALIKLFSEGKRLKSFLGIFNELNARFKDSGIDFFFRIPLILKPEINKMLESPTKF